MIRMNSVFISGKVSQDPILRKGCTLVMNICVYSSYYNKEKEEKQRVDFVNVVMFGKRTKALYEQIQKGSGVIVQGKLYYSEWEDKDGKKMKALNVMAHNIDVLFVNKEAEEDMNGINQRALYGSENVHKYSEEDASFPVDPESCDGGDPSPCPF